MHACMHAYTHIHTSLHVQTYRAWYIMNTSSLPPLMKSIPTSCLQNTTDPYIVMSNLCWCAWVTGAFTALYHGLHHTMEQESTPGVARLCFHKTQQKLYVRSNDLKPRREQAIKSECLMEVDDSTRICPPGQQSKPTPTPAQYNRAINATTTALYPSKRTHLTREGHGFHFRCRKTCVKILARRG